DFAQGVLGTLELANAMLDPQLLQALCRGGQPRRQVAGVIGPCPQPGLSVMSFRSENLNRKRQIVAELNTPPARVDAPPAVAEKIGECQLAYEGRPDVLREESLEIQHGASIRDGREVGRYSKQRPGGFQTKMPAGAVAAAMRRAFSSDPKFFARHGKIRSSAAFD